MLAKVNVVMSEDDSDSHRAAELSAQIRAHNEAYHSRDNPSVSDAEFDALLRELIAIETRRPDLVVEDSPTKCSPRLNTMCQ